MHSSTLVKGIGFVVSLLPLIKGELCDDIFSENNVECSYNDYNQIYIVDINGPADNSILEKISEFSELTELRLNKYQDTPLDLTILNKLEKLSTLLYNGKVDEKIFKDIASISSLKELKIENLNNSVLDFSNLKGSNISKLVVDCLDEEVISIVPNTLSALADTLTDLDFQYCEINEKDDFSSLTKVKKVEVSNYNDITLELISKMPSVEEVLIYHGETTTECPSPFDFSVLHNAPKLTSLSVSAYFNRKKNRDCNRIASGSLKVFKNLKHLDFGQLPFTQENIDEIATLNLESLTFSGFISITDEDDEDLVLNLDSLANLNDSLKDLSFEFKKLYGYGKFSDFPPFIFSLTNLKKLVITNSYIEKIPEEIINLQNLEYFDFKDNELLEFPQYLSSLKNLKYLDVSKNYDAVGNALVYNENLEYCDYRSTEICINENLPCIVGNHNSDRLKICYSECEKINEILTAFQNVTETSAQCNNGRVETLVINENEVDEAAVTELLSYTSVENLKFIWNGNQQTLTNIGNIRLLTLEIRSTKKATLDLDFIKNNFFLEKLTIINDGKKSNDELTVTSLGKLEENGSLFSLELNKVNLTQNLLTDIGKLSNLEILIINSAKYSKNLKFNDIKNCIKISHLELDNYSGSRALTEIPKEVFSLVNLEELIIKNHKLGSVSSKISQLTNLTYLDLSSNKLTSLPKALNSLPNLTQVNFKENSLKGKTVDNEKLEVCQYDNSSKLCKPSNLECLSQYNKIKLC